MEIQEIQKQGFYFDEPLLEYVGIVADECWPHYEVAYLDDKGSARILDTISDGTDMKNIVYLRSSNIPDIFGRRYVDGKIDTAVKADKYLASEEVMRTLKALGLDVSKFWYLCLFIKDYVMDLTVNAVKITPTHKEVLTNLVEEMDKMNPTIMRAISRIDVDKGGELTFKLEGEKHKITITDKQTLTLINMAISEILEPNEDKPMLKYWSEDCESKETIIPNLSTTKQIYLFDKYLSRFLDMLDKMEQFGQLEVKEDIDDGRKTSKDKKLLISRMIFILELSTDENYYREFDENDNRINKLKNTLNWYKKKTDIPTRSKIYCKQHPTQGAIFCPYFALQRFG